MVGVVQTMVCVKGAGPMGLRHSYWWLFYAVCKQLQPEFLLTVCVCVDRVRGSGSGEDSLTTHS